ncbi:MAG TPA: hypothetical protein VFB74_23720 [Kribbellaceae bacterium]|nr:hypothetical protein [Kribbellaceae bacterium]
MITHGRRLAAEAILVTACLMFGATGATQASSRHLDDLDLASSADPAPPHISDIDLAVSFDRAHGRKVKADAAATASTTCDNCTGKATTVQVIYLGNTRRASTHNVATAWSTSCRDCRATAVSVQLVVMRPGTSLTARNRALAVNAACESCATTSAAYQLIVVTKSAQMLSSDGKARLQALANQLASQLQPAGLSTARAARAAKQADVPSVDSLVRAELQPTSVRRHLDVKIG